MENLCLHDRRRRQSVAFAPSTESHDRYFARLPTPEESEPSQRSSDGERHSKTTRRHSPDRPARSRMLGPSERPRDNALFTNGSSQQRRPDSPPYQPSDGRRPSLPPLKTILANNLRSPPRSPTMHCSSVQPSPQEPAYFSATYKPPALYPQKKQRTKYVLEHVPPIASSESSDSRFFKSDALERRIYSSAPIGAPASPRTRVGESRRLSVQPKPAYPPMSPRNLQHRSHPYFLEPSPGVAAPVDSAPYEQPQPATSPPLQYRAPPNQYSAAFRTPQSSCNSSFERRDSTQALYEPSYPECERRVASDNESRPQYRHMAHNDDYEPSYYAARVERPRGERRPEGQYALYQASQPSFFMPSQYDYRHGRARKRSNLPKHSTEIMKTWFDQNISNPYPSEEQKAIFSNATGISMTQVSNWFINHRRRCPELRDKRDRTRGREFEM